MEFESVRAAIAKQLDLPEEEITMESRLIEDLKAVPLTRGTYYGLEQRMACRSRMMSCPTSTAWVTS